MLEVKVYKKIIDGEEAIFVVDKTPQEVHSEELEPFVRRFLKSVYVKKAMLTDRSIFVWGNERLKDKDSK